MLIKLKRPTANPEYHGRADEVIDVKPQHGFKLVEAGYAVAVDSFGKAVTKVKEVVKETTQAVKGEGKEKRAAE
ncbi:MAG: hypothetical protein ACRDHZ_02915 [Ktedonobacteraceae bacterium]